ncbi:MAG TPA: DUF3347 domain-containing protein [Ferruginibacter sp.]|nr:DUF3347 domain-containing protein [Ferruginibacter sp.]
MRRFLILFAFLLAVFTIYWFFLRSRPSSHNVPKQAPITLKKHSTEFNNSVDNMMASYLEIKNAFVDADTSRVKQYTTSFITLLDKIPIAELKKDTTGIYETAQANITDIRSNAESLQRQTDILEMRKDFSMVTEMMYPAFFKTINYEGPDLFLLHCPMAFEENGANWISNSAEVINPYLGKNHPKYKGTMLHCGEVRDSIKAE